MNCLKLGLASCLACSLASVSAHADDLDAPNGQLGAGLSSDADQSGRVWGELGFHTQDTITVLSPMIGGGFKPVPNLEVELVLPTSYASFESFGTDDDSAFELGNPYLGLSYVNTDGDLRGRVGGGIALPLANADDFGDLNALLGGAIVRGLQDYHWWLPDTLSIVGMGRLEGGDRFVASADLGLAVLVPTEDSEFRDTEVFVQLAPGVGGYVAEQTLIGVRLPLAWLVTEDGDNAQLALEPFIRQGFGRGFVNARFTMNLDEPLGFAFDDGGFWGLHIGGGGRF